VRIQILIIFKKYYPRIQYIWLTKINNFINTIPEMLQTTFEKPSVQVFASVWKAQKGYTVFPILLLLSRYSHIKKNTQLQAYLKFTTRIITIKIRMQKEKITLTFHGNAEPRRIMLLMYSQPVHTSTKKPATKTLSSQNAMVIKHTQSHNLERSH